MPEIFTHITRYKINNLVDFQPGERSLTNSRTQKKVTLQNPASYILLYLLQHTGTVIPQSKLITVGWGSKNTVTSLNTLYQTILMLRNALTEVGLPRDLIKTIARRGIIISAEVEIINLCVPENEVTGSAENSADVPRWRKRPFFRLSFITGTLAVTTLLLGIGVSVSLFYSPTESIVSAYNILDAASVSSCTVLLKGKSALNTRYAHFMNRHKEVCQHNNFVFIAGMSSAKNIGAIVCQTDLRRDPAAKCTTWYSIHNEN